MPLLKFNLLKGRSPLQVQRLLDVTHAVMVEAFKVPSADRYQLVFEHEPTHFVMQDTGLGIQRTDAAVLLEVISRPRSAEEKVTFYADLACALEERCQVGRSDLMVSFVQNSDADWSFGEGRAQFLTGEL